MEGVAPTLWWLVGGLALAVVGYVVWPFAVMLFGMVGGLFSLLHELTTRGKRGD